jgi:hypothetical protein
MMVLFLGGPWHNERHDVTPGRLASALRSLPTQFTVPLAADANGCVTYTRRFARAKGERLPVYVSPEYQGPARA